MTSTCSVSAKLFTAEPTVIHTTGRGEVEGSGGVLHV